MSRNSKISLICLVLVSICSLFFQPTSVIAETAKYKVALAQSAPVLADKTANMNTALKDIKKANQTGAKLIVFPEMFLTGYMILDGKDTSTVFKLAEYIDGPVVKQLVSWAKQYNIYIIMGMPLKSNVLRGIIYNAAVFVGPDGLIGAHRKIGLPTGPFFNTWFYEGNYFKPGEKVELFDTNLGRIGIMICYESWWPEIPRILAVKGADMIVCISAGPQVTEKGFDIVLAMRAMENGVYIAYVNLPNVEKGVKFFGGARLLNPAGQPVVEAKRYQEDFVVGDVDLNIVDGGRSVYPNIGDRSVFPDLWAGLTKRYPD
jgi:predicted amidohydrolase